MTVMFSMFLFHSLKCIFVSEGNKGSCVFVIVRSAASVNFPILSRSQISIQTQNVPRNLLLHNISFSTTSQLPRRVPFGFYHGRRHGSGDGRTRSIPCFCSNTCTHTCALIHSRRGAHRLQQQS